MDPEEWPAALGKSFHLEPAAISDERPSGMLARASLGRLAAYQLSGTPQMIRGGGRGKSADLLLVAVPLRGSGLLCQVDSQVRVSPGQLVMGDGGGLLEAVLAQPWTFTMLAFERAAISLPDRFLRGSMRRVVTLDDGPGAVLPGFIASAIRQGPSMGSAAERIGEAVLHLIAGTLGAAGLPDNDAAADAQRIRVIGYARRHLTEADLTHDRVAAALHMSPRTLHRLFEDEPYTVTEYIRVQRLAAARRDLADPLFRHRSIAGVAAHWGFASQAHFTRAFQAQYGVTPSAARHGETGQTVAPGSARGDSGVPWA
ncbi:AraC family transcriptional regulator [Actinoplanes sp. TBRC 11911]|uniref:AraC family transcriptional regulator n=1 Tax=Actinoplanes sp. TBRC 11911 TaxID=2729386 RepID=UPI00145E401D|nr:AraC family transcriptional regulator [Actinoplanes sp. TBRC 11911]NMO51490.1 AraC family transcriptional regulator [Actinoplanes sp. TBRC 11911]